MFISKGCPHLLVLLVCCMLLCSGKPKLPFSTGSITPAFVAQALNLGRKGAVPEDSAVAIRVYSSTFQDDRVENNDVLEYALRNQAGSSRSVPYLPRTAGYREVLFLLHIISRQRDDVWAYCSVWYALGTKQIGFGPAYRGVANNGRCTIQFDRSMSMREGGGRLYLKQGKRADFLFAFNALDGDTLHLDRIVLEEPNKIGGIKPFVFRVGAHFKDIPDLPFAYETTLRFNQ